MKRDEWTDNDFVSILISVVEFKYSHSYPHALLPYGQWENYLENGEPAENAQLNDVSALSQEFDVKMDWKSMLKL